MWGIITLLGSVGTAIVLVATAGGSIAHAQDAVTFSDHIRPIFERSCWNCHGEASQLSDLDLRSRETAIDGGTTAASTPLEVAVPSTDEVEGCSVEPPHRAGVVPSPADWGRADGVPR